MDETYNDGIRDGMNLNVSAWPKPFLVGVGVTKGGVAKSFTSMSLAGHLARRGYFVLLVDLNPNHDSFANWTTMGLRKEDCLFHCVKDDATVDRVRKYQEHSQYDFVIFDTSQYLQSPGNLYAWKSAHLMVTPIKDDASDFDNFRASLAYYLTARKGTPAPIAILPSLIAPSLPNDKGRVKFARLLTQLKTAGAHVPPFSRDFYLDNNQTVRTLDVRYPWSTFDGKVSEKFLGKLDYNMKWLVEVMEAHYQPKPAPRAQRLSSLPKEVK